jgi:O-antigen ligase
MSFDYPLGLGTRGFDSVAPLYIPQDVNTGNTRNRSVHSTWFEVLTELGYMGLFCFISMILCCLSGLKKVRKKLYQEGAFEDYFKMYAIQASLISFMLSMTFINRYRAEILYWLVLFSAAAYNIYILKDDKKVVKNET